MLGFGKKLHVGDAVSPSIFKRLYVMDLLPAWGSTETPFLEQSLFSLLDRAYSAF